MADLLQNGLAWLHRQRVASMTTPATYYPAGSGPGETLDVTATQNRVDRLDQNGFPVTGLVWDFIIAIDALSADPQPGDEIEFNGRRFQVGPLGEEPCFRFTDASRAALRIHTRDVGEAGSGS